MESHRVLQIDDSHPLLESLSIALQANGLEVIRVTSATEALSRIRTERYDVLLSGLHIPEGEDGISVVSAIRRVTPHAVTVLLGEDLEKATTSAIVMQGNEVLTRPGDVALLTKVIKQKLEVWSPLDSVATILERSSANIMKKWIRRVHEDDELMNVPLTDKRRCEHLPEILIDLVRRLRLDSPLVRKALNSQASAIHGQRRRQQGFTAAMMVEESRILQVCLFETLQENYSCFDPTVVLLNVMAIADEVDSQLGQALESYLAESMLDGLREEYT